MKKQAVLTLVAILSVSWSLRAGDAKLDFGIRIERAVAELKLPVKPEKPRKMLIYTQAQGFVHSSIPVGAKAVESMGQKTGAFEVIKVSDDPSVFDGGNLKNFDALLLMSTTGEFLIPKNIAGRPADEQAAIRKNEPERRQALMDYVNNGGGIVGIHAATDAYYKWAEYGELIGGYFNGHPFGKINIRVDDPKSPINAQFNGQNFEFTDEIYTYKPPYSREKLHVLLSIDLEKSGIKDDDKRHNRPDRDYAVAWIKEHGKGRVFYTLLGHREETFMNPVSMQFFLAGIQYALGDLKADATPSAKLPK